MTPTVYCDMDGVLADFNTAFADWSGMDVAEFRKGWVVIDGRSWAKLQKEWPTFWMDLDYMPNALNLWRAISKYRPSLLTACPPSWPSAGVGKRIWAKRMLPKFGYHPKQEVIAGLRADKKKYATQPDGTANILIDDTEKNLVEWTAAGGYSIHYIDSGNTMVQKVAAILEQQVN